MKSRISMLFLAVLIICMPFSIAENISVSNETAEQTKSFYVNEAEKLSLNIDAFDPDKEDILFYYFSPPIDENGSWTPGYDDSGEYTVEVRVSDGEFYDSTNVTIVVGNTDRAPIIIATGRKFAEEGSEISISIEAFDPDGDNLSFSAVDMPKDAVFENHTIVWTPGYDTVEKSWLVKVLNFYHMSWLKDDVEVSVTVSAKGNSLESYGSVPIVVMDKNRPPVIDEMEDIVVKETEKVMINPSADDPDGDYIRYFYSGWSNTNNKETGYDDAGLYNVTVMASDGLLSNSTIVNIIVENNNRYPYLNDIEDIHIKENQTLNIILTGSDPDNDNLIFMVSNPEEMPDGSEFSNNTFTWTPSFDTVEAKDITEEVKINFTVWDGENSDTKTAKIIVYHQNRPPVVSDFYPESSRHEIWVDQSLVFSVNATDPDGDEIKYKWNFGIINREIDSYAVKRIFRRPGVKMITGIASDGVSETSVSWIVKVKPPVKVKKVEIEEEKESIPAEYYQYVIYHPEEEPQAPEYYEFLIY